jgi:hypothetical protein
MVTIVTGIIVRIQNGHGHVLVIPFGGGPYKENQVQQAWCAKAYRNAMMRILLWRARLGNWTLSSESKRTHYSFKTLEVFLYLMRWCTYAPPRRAAFPRELFFLAA